MGLNIGNIDPQTIQKLLFGGPQAAMMPQDQQAPPQPQAAPPDGQAPRGSIASAMPPPEAAAPPSAPPAPAQVSAPAPTQNAPIAQAPQPYHHGTLGKIMLAAGEILGNPYATRIGERDRAREQELDEYNRNLPATQAQANVVQQKNTADLEHTRAQTNLEKVQADIAAQNLPLAEQAQKHYDHLLQTWQERATPDFDSYAHSYLAGLPEAIRRRLEPHLAEIKNAPQTGKGYKLNMQDDMPVSVESYGKTYQPDAKGGFGPDVSPQAVQDFQAAQKAHQSKRGEKLQDEKTVAGFAADRQAQAFSNQKQMDQLKQVQPRINTALDANERLARMESSYQKAVKGDQQAQLALLADHLGMTFGLQKGAKLNRGLIEEAQQSQPWLAKIGAKFDDRGFLSGVALGPEQMKQMLDLGYTARDRAFASAHEAATTYGQPLPQGFEQTEAKRVAGSKPAIEGSQPQLKVGQSVSVKGKQMKITAVHPDGSFDAQ